MFDTILGLPAHALIVHAAVVLAPILALLSVVFALVPRARGKLDWAVAILSVIVPISVFAARESGEALESRLFNGQPPESVETHQSYSLPLLFASIALGVVSLLMVWFSRQDNRTLTMAFGVLSVIGAVVVGYYVFRAGDSGARAVWGG